MRAIDAIRRANQPRPPENSIPLRAACIGTVLVAIAACAAMNELSWASALGAMALVSISVVGQPSVVYQIPILLDSNNQQVATVSNYAGTVHFTSSDAGASLPADYAFTAADSGVHSFAAGVMFAHEGTQSVTATDTSSSSITNSATFTLTVD